MQEDYKVLLSMMNDAKRKSPILLLGKASRIFKQYYKNPIMSITENDILVENDSNLVIISLETGKISRQLDNFIRKSTKSFIILYDKEDISRELLSLACYIIKLPSKLTSGSNLLTPNEALDKLKTLEDVVMESFYTEFSPSLKFSEKKVSTYISKNKIIKIIGDDL